ncbi:ATP-binding cassette domain-containing protein [Micromonospora sp. BRA006-A]|nr:ATP-binding cassette domain-containing protein [Micromonospora sp. BRA006-A]
MNNLDHIPSSPSTSGGSLPAGHRAHVRADGVRVVRGGRVVLSDVGVTVSAGSRLAVVGENGRGKTTLLHVLAGILVPDQGTVERLGTIGVARQNPGGAPRRDGGHARPRGDPGVRRALRALDGAAGALADGRAGADDAYAAALDAATRLDAWDAAARRRGAGRSRRLPGPGPPAGDAVGRPALPGPAGVPAGGRSTC